MWRRQAAAAGSGPIPPYQVWHLVAPAWRAAGGHEGNLRRLNGWRRRTRLGRSEGRAADERARAAPKHETPKRLAPGDPVLSNGAKVGATA